MSKPTTYKVAVEGAKVAARDILRARWIMNLVDQLNGLKRIHESFAKEEAQIEKRLAVATFKAEQAHQSGDPRAEDYKAELEREQKVHDSDMRDLEKRADANSKEIERVEKEIADVETGELKVSKENLYSRAKQLVEDRYGAAFVEGAYDTDAS